MRADLWELERFIISLFPFCIFTATACVYPYVYKYTLLYICMYMRVTAAVFHTYIYYIYMNKTQSNRSVFFSSFLSFPLSRYRNAHATLHAVDVFFLLSVQFIIFYHPLSVVPAQLNNNTFSAHKYIAEAWCLCTARVRDYIIIYVGDKKNRKKNRA